MIKKEKSIGIKALYHLVAIIVLLIISTTYFAPAFQGKVLSQSDMTQYQGMSQELREYYNNDGQSAAWTGSMFSGMPSYQIGVWGGSPNFLDYIEYPLKALGSNTAGPVFAGMLMAYILFCLMGVGIIPAMIGAVAYSLSSYNIIILDAGHVTKAWAIAYIPLVLSAFVAIYKNKYLLGGFLMALGLALEIKSNHLQITYYLAILCAFIYIGLLIHFLVSKKIAGLVKATISLIVGVLIGVLCNLGNIYANYEMSHESTRGKSELTEFTTKSEKQSSGLDKEYAFAWSYGKMETLSLLVPDINGGASGGKLSSDSHLYQYIKSNFPSTQLDRDGMQAQTYWGEQPFTSGPVYFGAIICFLFVFGMIVIKSGMKWALFAATLFFIFLSWGHNFESFNEWFFYNFPMYSKFRAVSTALVIPAITVVIIAIWGLSYVQKEKIKKEKLLQAVYISGGITGGICLLLMIIPGMFGLDFMSSNDSQWVSSVPEWYYQSLVADRKDLLFYDALRSLIFIILGAICLIFAINAKDKTKFTSFGIAIAVLVLIDLWSVDKRYLDYNKFETKNLSSTSKFFDPSTVDKIILEDKQPSYRVLNLMNPFNETRTSYFHKSIGGYHAAKLKRYQELIDHNLTGEIQNIIKSFDTQNIDSITNAFKDKVTLNMLNAKYIIFATDQPPLVNPYAMGNGWFVKDYKLVDNADQEIANLKDTDLKKTAIVDKKFEDQLKGLNIETDSTASIQLIEYKPDYLKYKSNAKTEQLAVLSEIYYPKGWEATIDGKPAPHIRADWTLRAIRIPAGIHDIEFKFIPHEYNAARLVASIFSGLLLLSLLGAIIWLVLSVCRRDKKAKS